MELGLFSFAEVPPSGTPRSRLRELVEEAALADAVGLDVFGVGEHHRPDYAASAPAVVLAAIAARTERIRLTSAVTVLSSDDPVRVFQQFATLDQLSDGRAEILVGRGSFTESFPLFGQALQDYDGLFSDKLDLLLRLRESERVTWSGRHRPALTGQGVYPRPVQDPLPVWIAVGGTPASVVRAGRLGLPLALAIIGGQPHRFRPLIDLYRQTGAQAGHAPETLKVSINGHGFLADTAAHAAEVAVGPFMETMGRIGRERGWPPPSRAQFEGEIALEGALVLGSAQQAIDKLLYQHELFGHDRHLLQLTVGPLPHAEVLRAIEIFGEEVAPVVRREVAARAEAA
ncbi:LLM class flavin-dependent oxidoreductase [Rubrivirga sp. IMCC45206]|uniref:LLM class flavin-dependent oxidoreductase n=1 Tax=Rubrivirga sp. IMCC45206 TaxID=3391614 RepID=UPI00398FA3E6